MEGNQNNYRKTLPKQVKQAGWTPANRPEQFALQTNMYIIYIFQLHNRRGEKTQQRLMQT